MRNLFLPESTPDRRPQGPVSVHHAVAVDGANAVAPPNRAMRRKGATFLREPAAKPARHTVCRPCGKRTWTSPGGTCRRCFLAGEGDLEVSFS